LRENIIKTEKEVAIDALARMKLTDVQKRAAEKSIRDLDWSGGTPPHGIGATLRSRRSLAGRLHGIQGRVDSLHKSLKPAREVDQR